MPHLRYLRYVLLHKLYVFMAGLALARTAGMVYERPWWYWPAWLVRLLVHDLSKFRPSEWRPYVASFYGGERTTAVKRSFDHAWLLHQHRNPHHWQHWVLREDSGATKVLTPPAAVADEMLADWLGAGTKILRWPSIAECVGETIVWYAANREKILLREAPRARVEEMLHMLASRYGMIDLAYQAASMQAARASIVIPGR